MITIRLGNIRSDFYDSSSTLSTINRNIAFAGIGIIWIFVKNNDGQLQIDNLLQIAVLLFAIALLCDIMQYIYKTFAFQLLLRHYEKDIEKKGLTQKDILEEFVEYNGNWNIPTWTFFSLKVLSVIAGYCLVFSYLINNFE